MEPPNKKQKTTTSTTDTDEPDDIVLNAITELVQVQEQVEEIDEYT